MIEKLNNILNVLLELGQDNYISMFDTHENRVNLARAISNSKLNDTINIGLKYLTATETFILDEPYLTIAKYLECSEDMARFLIGNGTLNLGKYIVDIDNISTLLSSEYLNVRSTNHTTHDIHYISIVNGNTASFSEKVKFLKFMIVAFEKNVISTYELKGREWLVLV